MAARQRARLPPTRMLNRGARGPCHRGNNSTGGEGERGCGTPAPTATGDGKVQSGWPEFRFELAGFTSFNGGQIRSKIARNQHVCHKIKILKNHIKGRLSISVPSELCAFVEANHLLLIPLIITHISFWSPDPRIILMKIMDVSADFSSKRDIFYVLR